jgi:2-C-methyl-D-erythritol 4-phosphate cytidylyltransferase
MSKFAVILPAAGKSSRFSKQRKKVFVELKGRPVWVRTAEQFVNRSDVIQTILVVSPDDLEWFKDKFRPNLAFMDIEVVTGGADVDFVAVHDAARPLVVKEWIDEVFRAAEQHDAAILATPVTSTLKRVDSTQSIEETVSRTNLWAAQTPQVFRRQLLLDAFARRGDHQPTDEAELVERIGHAVKIVHGSPLNLKITTPDDFQIAEHLLDALPKDKLPRLLHPFADEQRD